jgi:galactokinase
VFGGCTINLVRREDAAAFAEELAARYALETGITPQVLICHASNGAHAVSRSESRIV